MIETAKVQATNLFGRRERFESRDLGRHEALSIDVACHEYVCRNLMKWESRYVVLSEGVSLGLLCKITSLAS